MNIHPQIQKEYERINSILSSVQSQDTMDVAVASTLTSDELNEVLGAILDEGAHLTGVTMDAAGSIEGVAIFTFNTEWAPGQSRITNPDVACALVEVNPPRVIKVIRQRQGSLPESGAFTSPEGAIPSILQNLQYPSASEALEFNRQANESLQYWLVTQNIRGLRPGPSPAPVPPKPGPATGFTTGTKCTSLLCFEKTSDDRD